MLEINTLDRNRNNTFNIFVDPTCWNTKGKDSLKQNANEGNFDSLIKVRTK